MILADISMGHHALADVLFLVAVVLAVIALLVELAPAGRGAAFWRPLMSGAVASVALAWMVL